MIESIQKNVFEILATIGDNSLSLLLNFTGEFGENFLLLLVHFAGEINLKKIRDDTANVAETQKNLLMDILRLQKDTEYGKQYNFAAIQTVEEFLSRHPLTTYEDYQPIIDSITNTGNFTQLVAEPITLFQETSGTTGKVKLIPRTNRLSLSFLKASQAIEFVAESYFQKVKTSRDKPRGLALVNTLPVNFTPCGVPRGTGTSGGFREAVGKFKSVEKIICLKYSSPPSIFLVPDYESAYYCHLLFGLLEENLTYITANFAANVLEAIQILEKRWQQLVNDIQLGRIYEGVNIDDNTRNQLQSLLKPNPERAKTLKTEFEKGLDGILPRIWVRLSYIQCITTGSMHLYMENLKFYAGVTPFYSGGYGASEVWIGVNLEPQKESPAYVVTSDSAFFEFIPETEIDAKVPSTVKLTALKVDESYEVTVTTVAGLYRYRLGDIVKCVGYYNQSPIVEFLYRRQSLLNLAGEKVTENILWAALNAAIKTLGDDYQIVDYTTRMKFSVYPWKYVIYVEVSKVFEVLPDLKRCRDKMEQIILESNEIYMKLRATNTIAPLELKLVKENAFKRLKDKIVLGSETQFKMPRLLTNPVLIDFLEEMVIAQKGNRDEKQR